jgi:hypothetical protein
MRNFRAVFARKSVHLAPKKGAPFLDTRQKQLYCNFVIEPKIGYMIGTLARRSEQTDNGAVEETGLCRRCARRPRKTGATNRATKEGFMCLPRYTSDQFV